MGTQRKNKKPENQQEQWKTPEKRMKNQGVFYDEPKSAKVYLVLTSSSKKKLTELANSHKLSVSEYVERLIRNCLG